MVLPLKKTGMIIFYFMPMTGAAIFLQEDRDYSWNINLLPTTGLNLSLPKTQLMQHRKMCRKNLRDIIFPINGSGVYFNIPLQLYAMECYGSMLPRKEPEVLLDEK